MTNSDNPKLLLILAPVRGITDVVYRGAFAHCFGGFDRAIAPFIALKQGQALRPSELSQVVPERNRGLKTIPQVLANHGPTIVSALRQLRDAGHEEVNWNLGCPHPTTAGRGRGAGLLPHPGRIDAILSLVMAACPVRLSVKMRLGYHGPDDYVAVLEVLARYPLAEVALHARTADQMYEGPVDVERAALASSLSRHPFIYNGDILTPQGFDDLRSRLPSSTGWMVGRGALTEPFMPSRLRGREWPPEEERRRRLREFHDLLFAGYGEWLSGPGHLLDKIREHWRYLAHSFDDPKQVLSRLDRAGSVAAFTTAVDSILADFPLLALPPTQHPTPLTLPCQTSISS